MDNDLVIYEYDWLTAEGEYSKACETIISAVMHSDKRISFILYTTIRVSDASDYYEEIRNSNHSANLNFANEIISVDEKIESLYYNSTRRMEMLFRR